jgi:hypothetical protein
MSHVSYACSKYHDWFRELGYDRLDILEYPDGEWAIIEFETVPVIPSLTKWKTVLSRLRHIEITRGFVEKYLSKIDNRRKEFWDIERSRTHAVFAEQEAKERAGKDRAERAYHAMRQNPDLMNRIARNGLHEMNLDNIVKHIPRQKLVGMR